MTAPQSDLSEADKERIARLRQKVYQVAPEFVPFVTGLHAQGLVPGWRAIAYVGPHRETPPGYTGPIYSGHEVSDILARNKRK